MDREIKFRVFEPLNKKMHYLDFSLYKHDKYSQQNYWVLPTDRQCSAKDYTIMNLDSVHIMQYTGIKDKNGKEIYEGDIVEIKYNQYAFDGETLVDKYIKEYIVYNYLSFDICIGEHNGVKVYSCFVQEINLTDSILDEEWEIKGNIYENPELLKEIKCD
jgi:uncharacterized phage protein (TIGR01671 family)